MKPLFQKCQTLFDILRPKITDAIAKVNECPERSQYIRHFSDGDMMLPIIKVSKYYNPVLKDTIMLDLIVKFDMSKIYRCNSKKPSILYRVSYNKFTTEAKLEDIIEDFLRGVNLFFIMCNLDSFNTLRRLEGLPTEFPIEKKEMNA